MTPTRLLIVGDHPSLHRGFSTVGRHVARHLHQSGRWLVQYLGYYPRRREEPEEPYAVFDADTDDDVDDHGVHRFRDLLRSLILAHGCGPDLLLLLSIGTARDQRVVLDHLDELQLRSRIRFVGYMPVNYAPLPPSSAALLRRFDVLVPYTEHARGALRRVCAGHRPPVITLPIAHGVDLETFRPPEASARREIRRRCFGLEDDDLLIGFFGRNSGHKRPDVALRIFSAFARGEYVWCAACERVTARDHDDPSAGPVEVSVCSRCGSSRLEPGASHASARLYMHTELGTRGERRDSGGWDLERLAAGFGISAQVQFDRRLRIGEGVPASELALRMGACDLHLLPFEGGGWELTVLETAACGVANVITNAGAPPEYAAPFSELVPVACRLFGATGMRSFIDVGQAVGALLQVAHQPGHRQRLSQRGQEAAAAYSWTVIGQEWHRLLATLAAGGCQ